MTSYSTLIAAAAALAVSLAATPSMALTAQECSAKYNAAKAAGTLNGMKWNDFRKAQCGDDATPAAAATGDAATAAATTTGAGGAVFPKAVDPKYAKEKPGKARMHTCRDQYKVNKAANANGGMKWIQKGGGYYSACNKVLKAI
jgi:hypothetical protein